jgi:hypothetical protein
MVVLVQPDVKPEVVVMEVLAVVELDPQTVA